MKKENITVGLMGHSFHCTNLGVGALAISECAILQKVADRLNVNLKIICFEAGKGENDYRYAAESDIELMYYTYSPKMIKHFKQCDLIIDVTGGDSFSDIYGDKIYLVGIVMKIYALLSGRRVILAPQTIGPFKKKGNRRIANVYMHHVKKIFLRDQKSRQVFDRKNQENAVSTADMAFRLPYNKSTEDVVGKVGFNVSGLLYDEKNMILREKGFNYAKMCEEIIELLLQRGKKVVLVSHVIGDEKTAVDNDYYASLQLKEKYPELEVAPVFNNPVEAKSYISGLDFFIGSRMHAVIAAVSSGVPAIPIAYSRKFEGVFEPVGYDVTLDATSLTEQEIIQKVEEYLDHPTLLESKVKEVGQNAREKLQLYETYLEREISQIIG